MSEIDDLLVSNRALLESFRRGERDALSAVFREYAGGVARQLRGGVVISGKGPRLGVGFEISEAELEDLVQATFVRAFKASARQSYDGLRPYRAYLAAIARNLAIDRARSEQRRAQVAMTPEALDALPAEERSPVEGLTGDELSAVVDAVWSALPERERAVFEARFVRTLSLRATARELDIPLITVRRVDRRLRDQMRKALHRSGHLP